MVRGEFLSTIKHFRVAVDLKPTTCRLLHQTRVVFLPDNGCELLAAAAAAAAAIQTDLFPSLSYRRLAPPCVVVEMLVHSNGVRESEWGPGYQGAAVSLGPIKFSAAEHLSGQSARSLPPATRSGWFR